jgi:signal transduction histidine kinase
MSSAVQNLLRSDVESRFTKALDSGIAVIGCARIIVTERRHAPLQGWRPERLQTVSRRGPVHNPDLPLRNRDGLRASAYPRHRVRPLCGAAGVKRSRARVTAENESHMKATLLTAVNQELRIPLTVIKGSATTLLQHERRLPRAEQQEFLRTISGATDQLKASLDYLARLATLEAEPLALRKVPIDLVRVVRQSIEAFDEKHSGQQRHWQDAYRVRHAGVSSRRTRARYRVRADAHWLSIATYFLLERASLQKLADEAIDVLFRPLTANQARPLGASHPASYATVEEEALLSAGRPTRQCVLTTIRCVSPSAPPSEQLDLAGALFALVNTAVGQDMAELGLGYALCQRIVQLHGGDMCVEGANATEPNTGARGVFHVVLPTEGGTSGSAVRKK